MAIKVGDRVQWDGDRCRERPDDVEMPVMRGIIVGIYPLSVAVDWGNSSYGEALPETLVKTAEQHVIDAAPALLAACRAVMARGFISDGRLSVTECAEQRAVVDRVRDAIAKAEGQ